jgi:hypothetical protein
LPLIARAIIVVAVAALLAFQVVRSAAVEDPSTQSTLGARLWPSNPSVITELTMAEIGARAAKGESLSPAILRQVEDIARKAPLAPEPFLIHGALAQVQQRQGLAERFFTVARSRDPRSQAARYFLAEQYLRTGRTEQALAEMAVLSRLVPNGTVGLAPSLAQFARTPGAVPQLRSLFRSSPEFEPMVLSQLASDARNADLVMALWGGRPGSADPRSAEWQSKLVNMLVEQGQFAKAHATWRRLAGVNQAPGAIFNPGFAQSAAPPPFNWKFASGGGVVEPSPGDRLQVIYFGREDVVLAEQLLLLGPGRYRLSMAVSAPPGEGGEIAWTITCLPKTAEILRLPIRTKSIVAGDFSVPPGCSAQRLQLHGLAGDFPQSQELTVGRLELRKVAGQ